MPLKTGPLTRADFLAIWKSSLDAGYRDPLLAAGEGNGLEVHTQAMAQFERVSLAVDRTTQAMFIAPWSGQTAPSAAGEARSTVTLTLARTLLIDRPLVLAAGQVVVEEETTDAAPGGGVEVLTGRRYLLAETLVFHPGEAGPLQVQAVAEFPGWGYDDPLPGTIAAIAQPGAGLNNDHAAVQATAGSKAAGTTFAARVVTPNEADTFVPEHVGQYVRFTSGANLGNIARVVSFEGPDLSVFPAVGSSVELAVEQSVQGTAFAGAFVEGEGFTNGGATASGRVIGARAAGGIERLTFAAGYGAVAVGDVLTGALSGATLTVSLVLSAQTFASESPVGGTGGATWRVIGWAGEWGLTATNASSPAGGRLGWLDELGSERAIDRAPGEPDDVYLDRVRRVADVVTPNAIRRALQRNLGGMAYCLREVGTPRLRGMYYDGDRAPVGASSSTAEADLQDAYDVDCVVFSGGGVGPGTFSTVAGGANQNEQVVLRNLAGDVFMRGYFGALLDPATFLLVRTEGVVPASLAGLYLLGLTSGQDFSGFSSAAVPVAADARRFRRYFDTADMRAFFLVGVPRLGAGEFGFAYDAGPHGAYDAFPYAAFYDGFPVQAAAFYRRVRQSLEDVKAGGVGFDLYVEGGACP